MATRQNGPALVAALGAVAVTSTVVWLKRRQTSTKEFHMEYQQPPQLPLALRLITCLPKRLRRSLAIAGQKPKPPLDGVDLIGPDYDPYKTRELVPDKIWRVRYEFATDPSIYKFMKDIYGLDLSDHDAILKNAPPEKREMVQAGLNAMDELNRANQGLDLEQQLLNKLKMGQEDTQDMLVARLDDGGLMLYNPCRLHSKMTTWLKQLGPVKYIVSGSSSHTNQLPQAAVAFPEAKIICAEVAELKCTAVGMRAADFIYTDHSSDKRSYQAAVQELESLGVRLFHVVGDVMTQSLFVIVHNHLFDTDLGCYGNGQRWLHLDEGDWDKTQGETDKFITLASVFYYAAMHCSSVPGYLPNYRINAMDHTSPINKLMLEEPDETSCTKMAESLRELLKMEFSYVDSAHSKKQDSLPAEDFKKCLDAMWNWLDGKSLLVS